jgi:hypothetical protein
MKRKRGYRRLSTLASKSLPITSRTSSRWEKISDRRTLRGYASQFLSFRLCHEYIRLRLSLALGQRNHLQKPKDVSIFFFPSQPMVHILYLSRSDDETLCFIRTAKTAQLFYNVNLTELCMNDCTRTRSFRLRHSPRPSFRSTMLTSFSHLKSLVIEPSGFTTLSSLCPNLTSLTLNLCGQLSSDALLQWADHLPHLQRLELLGPFLVRKEAWLGFFDKVGEKHRGNGKGLKGFLITQSPRFDLECCEKMVQECPALTELRLCEVGKRMCSSLRVCCGRWC